MNGLIALDERLAHLRSDTDRIAMCLRDDRIGEPVAACPGWNLRKLTVHVGFVHRWATYALANAAPAPREAITLPPADMPGDALGDWLRDGAATLVDLLATTEPDTPTWHPFPAEQRAAFWSARQMLETAVHRWDAEMAANGTSDLDTRVAVDGIAEFFQVLLPRVFSRDSVAVPTPSLHVHCTDDGLPPGAGEWIVWNDGGEYRAVGEHRKGDAALRGSAVDLLLVLTGRADRSILDIVGDPDAAAAWLDLPGL